MTSKYHKRTLHVLPITPNSNINIEVELYYTKGGFNAFSHNETPRGLWLSVSPITYEGMMRSYTGFSGAKVHVKEMSRYNHKQLEEFEPDNKMIERMVRGVAGKKLRSMGVNVTEAAEMVEELLKRLETEFANG